MKQKNIIEIINTKENWVSSDLIDIIISQDNQEIEITFYHIGGYELLSDGTQTRICKSLKDVHDLLKYWDMDFDKNISDPLELVKSIESDWEDSFDDGGGSGWIEYKSL